MSYVLTRHTRRGGPTVEVRLATTAAEHEAVERLRHQIYVEELGILPADHDYVDGERLRDPFDAWSTQLLALVDGAPAGTARLTEALDGPLEIDGLVDWRARVPADASVAEVTRFMVARPHRRLGVGPMLAHAAYRVLAGSPSPYVLAAGKLGNLGRYYRNAGFDLLSDAPFEYTLTGCRYHLLGVDLGRPGTLRRGAWQVRTTVYRLLAVELGLQDAFRRGFRPGRGLAREGVAA